MISTRFARYLISSAGLQSSLPKGKIPYGKVRFIKAVVKRGVHSHVLVDICSR